MGSYNCNAVLGFLSVLVCFGANAPASSFSWFLCPPVFDHMPTQGDTAVVRLARDMSSRPPSFTVASLLNNPHLPFSSVPLVFFDQHYVTRTYDSRLAQVFKEMLLIRPL